MKHVDAVRGFERTILLDPQTSTRRAVAPLTNCVVEVLEKDWQGNCPILSLRFYHKPYCSAANHGAGNVEVRDSVSFSTDRGLS
jgi:hypothetical protein